MQAPTLAGVYGSEVDVVLPSGQRQRVVADEQYLRESIMDSGAKVVAGYKPIMPSFRQQLSEEQLIQLIAYIKSLRGAQTNNGPPPEGGPVNRIPDKTPATPGPSQQTQKD